MLGDLRTREWLPLLVTVGLFAAVVYGTYAPDATHDAEVSA